MENSSMSARQKTTIAVIILLLILFLFGLLWKHRHVQGYASVAPEVPQVSTAPVTAPVPDQIAVVKPAEITPEPTPKHAPRPVSKAPLLSGTTSQTMPATSAPVEVPGQKGMHRELIPKNITIERCYYTEEVVNPGTQFYFEINGSGFDSSFYRSITIDPDALDVEVKDLKFVTANQIQGLMVVGEAATTEYIYPKVLIRGLPVFKAPEPFGVVRHGEVLDILLTSIDDSGQWGKFRVITNLDDDLYKRIKIAPSTAHLDISDVKPLLPFYIDGAIEIAPGLASGSYGLSVLLGTHEIYRKQPLVEVVKPNIGKSGSIESVDAKDPAHRPGDTIEFTVDGSGFLPNQTPLLSATVDHVATPPAIFTYLSIGKYAMSLAVPPTLPKGVYSLTVRYKTATVYHKKEAFVIVPPNWVSNVQLTSPLAPGGSSQIQVKGRDLSAAFMATLRTGVDEPGLTLSPLRQQDDRTYIADIKAAHAVAPGDYIIHLNAGNTEIRLPRGNIIKVTP